MFLRVLERVYCFAARIGFGHNETDANSPVRLETHIFAGKINESFMGLFSFLEYI